ncbi:hypothetical protein SEA_BRUTONGASTER_153 [Gordonia phage BrutonGaster]|uniref:Uncharacterized protein n=1 Tax=Gordonia phage BrutonGaster TaxID=2530116 RepID=A0A482JLV4_9CAUD|nr:hypothetical protein HOV26_gp029 [Gordonia phage BrutonGaster]QBP33367.1 hypothetical protein SEA_BRUTONGASTER_153 [Gordonia phage BrutonGaster]
MTTNISRIADQIDPRQAQLALARIMKTVGELDEWDAETIEFVLMKVERATPKTMLVAGERIDWPSYTDGDDRDAVEFWQEVEP